MGIKICSSEAETGGAGQGSEADTALRSPGTQPRHYAPQTQLTLSKDAPSEIPQLIHEGHRVGWLCNSPEDNAVQTLAASPDVLVIPMPSDPAGYARSLYATLHALDQRGLDRLIVDAVPPGPEWAAVRDRLKRAAM